jgi:hypothetical protein
MSAGGALLLLILWAEWAIPGRFVRGTERSRKAMSLAREALGEKTWSGCLDGLRKSILQSFLFKTYLRFNSKTMQVPEDEQGTLEYFHQTLLPEQERRLAQLAGWKSRVSLGVYETLLMALLVLLFVNAFQWHWISMLAGAAVIVTVIVLFYHFYRKLLGMENEYLEVLRETDLKLEGFEAGEG